MKPIIFIVFDGLGDRPVRELDWQTPLESAYTPNLNALAKFGITGLLHTIERGVRPGSDVAHLSLFGYDPRRHYHGRGTYEAAGYGIELQKGDIAFRANLATIDKNNIVIDRRAGRIDSSAPFAKLLNGLEIEGIKIIAAPGLNHRVAIVLRGKHLSNQICDTDPHLVNHKIKKCIPLDKGKEAQLTASVVNKLTEKSLSLFKSHDINLKRRKSKLPEANCLLLRGAGRLSDFKSFYDAYNLKAACVAGAGLYKGISRILGMDIIDVKGANGKPNTNLKGKIMAAIELTKSYDFIFVHFKAADSLAEDGKAVEKKEFIEKADKVLADLIPLVKKQKIILAVTADHTTSSELKIHTADEVPILTAGFGVRSDNVSKFGERPCQSGGLGHMEGRNLIDFLINLRGQTKLYGN